MSRKELASYRRPLADRVLSLAGGAGDRTPLRAAVEHMIAVTYGMTYDAVVTRFRPYEAMIEEIIALVTASRRALKPGGHAIFLTYNRPARVVQTFREARHAGGLGAAVGAIRWLVPTAAFEWFRDCDHRYMSETEFHEALDAAGFDVLEAHPTFLAGLSHLAWARARA